MFFLYTTRNSKLLHLFGSISINISEIILGVHGFPDLTVTKYVKIYQECVISESPHSSKGHRHCQWPIREQERAISIKTVCVLLACSCWYRCLHIHHVYNYMHVTDEKHIFLKPSVLNVNACLPGFVGSNPGCRK